MHSVLDAIFSEKGTLHDGPMHGTQMGHAVKYPPLQAGHLTQPPLTDTSKALSCQVPFYGKTNERTYVIKVWGRVVKGQRRIELSHPRCPTFLDMK